MSLSDSALANCISTVNVTKSDSASSIGADLTCSDTKATIENAVNAFNSNSSSSITTIAPDTASPISTAGVVEPLQSAIDTEADVIGNSNTTNDSGLSRVDPTTIIPEPICQETAAEPTPQSEIKAPQTASPAVDICIDTDNVSNDSNNNEDILPTHETEISQISSDGISSNEISSDDKTTTASDIDHNNDAAPVVVDNSDTIEASPITPDTVVQTTAINTETTNNFDMVEPTTTLTASTDLDLADYIVISSEDVFSIEVNSTANEEKTIASNIDTAVGESSIKVDDNALENTNIVDASDASITSQVEIVSSPNASEENLHDVVVSSADTQFDQEESKDIQLDESVNRNAPQQVDNDVFLSSADTVSTVTTGDVAAEGKIH